MEEEKLLKIEEEISKDLKDKIKDVDSKDSKKIIETEIRSRNYLSEDWQIGYAVQRIQEKIEEIRRQQRVSGQETGVSSGDQVLIRNFANEIEARFAQKFLENNNIKSVLQFGVSIYGAPTFGSLGVPMFVLAKDLEKAKDLLNQL